MLFKRVWLAAFAVFFALAASWSFATPLGSSIDEPGHMLWAAAASDGQLHPARYYETVQWSVELRLQRAKVRVPKSLAKLDREMDCYAFKPSVAASCVEPLNSSDATVHWTTVMASYDPLYYVIVGWPVHLIGGLAGLYAMRLISALICAALLASAAGIALSVGRVAFGGVLLAATPMLLSLAGSVNPNGPEAAGGLLAWTALAALALDPKPGLSTRRVAHLALGAGVLTLVRPAGLFWLVLLLAMAVLVLGSGGLRDVLAVRRVRLSLGALGLTAVAAEGWNHFLGGLNVAPTGNPIGYTLAMSVGNSIRTMPAFVQQMIGVTGWLDTPAPYGTVAAWLALLGLFVLGAMLLGTRRELVTLLLLIAGVVLIPILANAHEATGVGNLWEGRYLLWWVAGLPVISAMVITQRGGSLPAIVSRRLPIVAATLIAAAQVGMYWIVVRRYGVGLARSLMPTHFSWSPPMTWFPSALLLLAGLLGAAALAVGVRRRTERSTEPSADLVSAL